MCCLKVDMVNGFNWCDCSSFLEHVKRELPDPWVQLWCYSMTRELDRILSTSGVQQGVLYFLLAFLQLLDMIGAVEVIALFSTLVF